MNMLRKIISVWMAALLVGLIVAPPMGTSSAAASNPLPQVSPEVECVTDNGGGAFTAWFGYNNLRSQTVNVPVGLGNLFLPLPLDRGQPRKFQPGRQRYVFSVTQQRGGIVAWELAGKIAVATLKRTTRCEKVSVQITSPANNSITSEPSLTVSGRAQSLVAGGSIARVYVNEVEASYNAQTKIWSRANVALNGGTNAIVARAVDGAGNQASVQVSVTRQDTAVALESVLPGRAIQGQTLQVELRGRNTHWVGGQTRASFGGEVSVGGAPAGEPGLVAVTGANTAVVDIVISPTAALAPRTVTVTTPAQGGGAAESAALADAFTVVPATPPGSSSTNVATIAGTAGAAGFADGAGGAARFRDLSSIAIGPDDAIYVADAGNHRIRVVRNQPGTSVWVVSTLAGDGTPGIADGTAAAARFNNPQGIAVDGGGGVFVADTGNHRIRRIAPDGNVTTVAGDGTAGLRDGAGAQAQFNAPRGLAVDTSGNIYVADTGNAAVRVVASTGEVRTAAGDGTVGASDSPGARFNGLAGVAVDGENIYVYLADAGNHRIRRLDVSGAVITIAGADRGFADGSGEQSRFAEPSGIAVDGAGKIVIADAVNSLVRAVDPELLSQSSPQAVATLAGSGERGSNDGTGSQASFSLPRGLAVAQSSAIIVADTGNQSLRRVTLPPVITALAPASARPLDTIKIYGARFDARAPERNTVRFTRPASAGGGETVAQVTAASRRELTVIVPADADNGPVTVQTEGGTAISPDDFALAPEANPPPAIADFNPTRGAVGATVTLTGTNLKALTGNTVVTFAGSNNTRLPALVSFASPTEVRAVVPSGVRTGTIRLTTAGGDAATGTPFTVEQTFEITLAPSAAAAIQRGTATYVVSLNSPSEKFTQLARLSAIELPAGVTATFAPSRITSGGTSTLRLDLTGVDLAPGNYPFTVKAAADIDGSEQVRSSAATLDVRAGAQTTLSGRVLATDDQPIMGATVSLDGRTATTDAAGSFLLTGITAGTDRAVMVDGRTASAPNRVYPVIAEPATIVAGQANVVPYIFYLPVIDTQYEVSVVPGMDTVVTTPRLSNARVIIPAGANLRNRDGSPVTRVSWTPVPIDRTPAPLPANVSPAMVFTLQPGGAVADVPMPVVYPNLTGQSPAMRAELWAFNHDSVQWYVYGYGRVSADGRVIEPEVDPATGRPYGLRDFSWHFAGPGGAGGGNPANPKDCPKPRTGNPVDLFTGFKLEPSTDIALGSARGDLTLTRHYSSGLAFNRAVGRFGRGTKDNYDIKLTGTFEQGGSGRFVEPEFDGGVLFSYVRTDPDGSHVFMNANTVGQLGDEIRRLSGGALVRRDANGGVMNFDSNGRLTSIVDANGNATTLTYSGAALTRITDALGRSITLDYDAANRISRARDSFGREWVYGYDISGTLVSVKNPRNLFTRYRYSDGLLTAVIDARGNVVKEMIYTNGRVAEQKFANGKSELYSYAFSGNVLTSATVTDTLGKTTSQRYNATGAVIGLTDEFGQSSRIVRDLQTNLSVGSEGPCGCAEGTRQFDAKGNVLVSTDRNGKTERFEYDPVFNHVTKMTDGDGRVTNLTYDGNGNLTSLGAPGAQTVTTYDEFGQLTSNTDHLNRTTRYEYDAAGNQTAIIDHLNNRTTREYDALGRVTAKVDPLGRRTTTTYDEFDQIVAETNETGAISTYTYDPYGNRTSVKDALGNVWKMAYDEKSRLISRTDPLGRVTRMTYNADDQLVSQTLPSGRVIRRTYDARGQLATVVDTGGNTLKYSYSDGGVMLSLTDQRDHTTTFTYDHLGRLLARRDPLGQVTRTVYNEDTGNVSEVVDRQGRRTAYSYDAFNRSASVNYGDAAVTYTYDAAGRVTRIDDTASGSVERGYDGEGRLTSETTAAGTVAYTYNDAGQRTSMKAADRVPVTYGYDAAGRLRTIMQGAETFTYNYDALSRVESLQRPNGVTTRYAYDVAERVERLLHADASGQAIEDYRYRYTADDRIESVTSIHTATQQATAERSATTADAANRISSFGTTSFNFNSEGETIGKSDAQGATAYEWDARGRLARATLPGGQSVSYTYDALGRRASRTVAGGAATLFLYDGVDVVLDRDGDGGTTEYTNGPGIDQKLRQSSAGTGSLYFLTDHQGSTVALANGAGAVVERQVYEVFGAGPGSALTRYGYTGRERDDATGLMYYRARWYDPAQGRFLTEDPAGFEGGANLYAYTANNPINATDPTGNWPTQRIVMRPAGGHVHQNSIQRMIGSLLPRHEVEELKHTQHVIDTEDNDLDDAHKHAMTSSGATPKLARIMANKWVRERIEDARCYASIGKRMEAMRELGLAIHTLQDHTSPAHNYFKVWSNGGHQAWMGYIPALGNYAKYGSLLTDEYKLHMLRENYDPGRGSQLDLATGLAYYTFSLGLPLPFDFFGGLRADPPWFPVGASDEDN